MEADTGADGTTLTTDTLAIADGEEVFLASSIQVGGGTGTYDVFVNMRGTTSGAVELYADSDFCAFFWYRLYIDPSTMHQYNLSRKTKPYS